MNGEQIGRYLHKYYKHLFIGVFASDELPTSITCPSILVCNTDASNLPGEHWISIFIDVNGCGEFFDSFGREPGDPFVNFMNRNCMLWTFNDKQLQNILSSFCGHYCIFYSIHRSRGMNMIAITKLFSDNTNLNDYLVHKFVCRK